jgi:hypothetical protein
VKRADVIKLIKAAARERTLIFREHALDEMDQDGEVRETIATAIEDSTGFTKQPNGRWRLSGAGIGIIVHVTDHGNVIIWTVFV